MFRLGVKGRGGLVEDEKERTVAHECPRERELLPLAEAHFDSTRPGRAELRVETGAQSGDDIVGAGAADGGGDRNLVVETRHVADADTVTRRELEAEEILERAGEFRAPRV